MSCSSKRQPAYRVPDVGESVADRCSFFADGHGKTIEKTLPSSSVLEFLTVLGIVPFGGPNITFAKPIDTFFELSINSAPSPFGEQSFEQI